MNQRDPAPGLAHCGDVAFQASVAAGRVKPTLRGQLLALLRYEANGVGTVMQGNIPHFCGRRHFEVERQVNFTHQTADVVIANVAAILAQVRGDSVGPGIGGNPGRTHRIGVLASARVPDRGDVVDVHAQPQPLAHGDSSLVSPMIRRQSAANPLDRGDRRFAS